MAAESPRYLFLNSEELGRYNGRKIMYQEEVLQHLSMTYSKKIKEGVTWLVQTLLNVTNAKVWANIVEGRSFFASIIGSANAESKS